MKNQRRLRRVPSFPALANHPARDARVRNQVDTLDCARCPVCAFPLVARIGRGGPYFFCRCARRRKAG